ncbi:hypothetical protein [Paractinoplanes atraurantiacus]|uniref:Lipoprotein n=1 Tax=Paractinoplanes atraurantiacus TaxID=1036182 RepID=A0A285IR25_9ACTN|nr:hypothetical protein [Actinoplanes atraurantiacus]SNY50448.1 hypothetical protein SAMN05421748_1112 [Actinoplanes atraurantiacus]
MRVKRLLAGTAAGATALAFAGACAQQIKQIEPKLELRNAASQLSEAKQTGFTVKLTGSPEDLAAGLKLEDPTDVPDAETLKKLFNSSFTIATDKAGEGDKDDRASLSATIDGVTGTELRVIDGVVYVKAPVQELATKFGAAASDVTEMRQGLTGELPEAAALFDGKWVSVDVAKAAEGALGKAATPSQDPAQAAKLQSEIQTSAKNLFESAQIVRDSADPTHLTVTSSTTKGYEEFQRLAGVFGKELGTDVTKELPKAPKERPITLDLWIKDEKLTAIEVNFLQFIDGATGRAALRFEVTTGAEIAAPEGATKIDPSKLTSGLTGGGATPSLGGGLDDLDGDTAYTEARLLGLQVQLMQLEKGNVNTYLKQAVAERNAEGDGVKAGVVRSGVAQVAADGAFACLKVSASKEPVVTKGRC